jgi:hypothetical protein
VGLVQAVLVVMGWLAMLSLELRIRLAGGSGAFIETAPLELFSLRHRQIGTAVFGGLCFTAASATGVFAVAFVL